MRARRLRPGEGWERVLFDLLTITGWTWVHTKPAFVPGRRAPITAMEGPGAKGWPDITAHRAGRFLVAEAKSGDASLSPLQRRRLADIDAGGIVEAYLFHERDLETIRSVLQHEVWPPLIAAEARALQPWRYRRSRLDAPSEPGAVRARVRG